MAYVPPLNGYSLTDFHDFEECKFRFFVRHHLGKKYEIAKGSRQMALGVLLDRAIKEIHKYKGYKHPVERLVKSVKYAADLIVKEEKESKKRPNFNTAVVEFIDDDIITAAENKQKLADWEKKIETFNDLKSNDLETQMLTQGAILDEFIRRNEINEKLKTDGKTRNLADPIENARYWLTYAHEAVAYQAAKVYVFNATGESAINQNILSTINEMESDLNGLRAKVQKSQNIISQLVNENQL